MGKVKNFFQNEQRSILLVLRKYVGTLSIVFLLCMYCLVLDIADITFARNEEYLTILLIMMLTGVFFTENCLRPNKSKEITITGYILSGVLALLWVIVDVVCYNNESTLVKYYYIALMGFYVLILTGLSLLAIIRESRLSFEQYAVRMIFSCFRIFLILLVLNLGFLLILYMVDLLIVPLKIGTWIVRMELFLIPIVYVPYFLSCLTNRTEERPSGFVKGLVLYALMPIYMAAVLVIYIYMARIVITWTFPVNQVFYFCAGIFSVGVVIWTMAYAFTKHLPKSLYNILIRYMKYIVSPFILLELYAIILRINACGWTTLRVFGVYFIIVQFIYTAWEPLVNLVFILLRKTRISYSEHYEWMLYVLMAVYFFGIILPWTSAEYVEDISQESRLTDIVREITELKSLNRDWTPEEYQNMAKLQYDGKSARLVLLHNIYGEVFLKTSYKSEQLESLLKMPDTPSASGYAYDEYDEWSFSSYYSNGYPTNHLAIPIRDYSQFYLVSRNGVYDETLGLDDLKKIRLTYGMNQLMQVDLSSVIRNMVEQEKGKMIDPTTLFSTEIPEGRLIITQITYRYSEISKQVKELRLEGYLFIK
ncbi:MAG: DUF4153 domain-containing protein [Eubacterium sp.]|nr:DUF4153 domain-containing protein [Eubacterium sp.]